MPAIGSTAAVTAPTEKLPIRRLDQALDGAEILVDALARRGDSPHTRRAYALDLVTFGRWLDQSGLLWREADPDKLDRYREWLAGQYARSTVNRRLTVVRGLYAEALRRRLIPDDPATRLRALRGRDDRDGGALTRLEAQDVLQRIKRDLQIPSRCLVAVRDLALVSLLLRTGIRRSELAGLRVTSLSTSGGHRVLTLRAKGNVLRTVKVPPDLGRALDDWLRAAADAGLVVADDHPLFVRIRKGGRAAGYRPLSDRAIYAIVERRVRAAGPAGYGPHALRATFVTLALEGGAPLHIVQRAVGHADPRTTEAYWRRRDSLDDNAVDYIRL
jgi:site-specific recombinase XerD